MKKNQSYASAFKASDLIVELTKHPKEKPKDATNIAMFGRYFTDHMLTVEWTSLQGWGRPEIKPLEELKLHPACSVLHYATTAFEGMKAYRTVDNKISLFRPVNNMERMRQSAKRATLPDFNAEEFLKCISELIKVDKDWIPHEAGGSLYIRPTFIATQPSLALIAPESAILYCILCPVGQYFVTGSSNAISLLADPSHTRAFPGGAGDCKMGCNYAPTIQLTMEARKRGCQQVLWLFGDDHKITEVGTMNFFIYWVNEAGEKELTTMPLDKGIVLPGITRDSILQLSREWGEFNVTERTLTMSDVTSALKEDRIIEMFGSGTACDICPVGKILYLGQELHIPTMENGAKLSKRILEVLSNIKQGRCQSDWTYIICNADEKS